MICYTIQCDKGHKFEGWFRNSATYDTQAKSGDVLCPECGSVKVSKAPMAPAVARSGGVGTETISATEAAVEKAGEKAGEKAAENTTEAGKDNGSANLPVAADTNSPANPPSEKSVHYMGKVREALVEIRRYVEANSDYVGKEFVDEARKIHSGDAEERSIYGEASEEEAEELSEEGISVGRIPWVRKTDA
jgi:hypothetical protein